MLNDNLIANLEQTLHEARSTQSKLMAHLREVQGEADQLRDEIRALETIAQQTESNIDSLLVTMRSGNRSSNFGSSIRLEEDKAKDQIPSREVAGDANDRSSRDDLSGRNGSVTYIHQPRGVPSRTSNMEAISHRFSDRTITQACTLLLRESAKPLHVNELYNLLVAGGMKFKGNNPTISVAVSLSRNRRFRKVEPGTFDLVIREATQMAS